MSYRRNTVRLVESTNQNDPSDEQPSAEPAKSQEELDREWAEYEYDCGGGFGWGHRR